jgi:ketol-acid reductoisomerase
MAYKYLLIYIEFVDSGITFIAITNNYKTYQEAKQQGLDVYTLNEFIKQFGQD